MISAISMPVLLWNNAAQYYNWTGEFGEALAISEELLKLNEELKSPYLHILMQFRRGLIYGALGRLEEAKENLESGLKPLESGDDRFWRPCLINTLGWIYSEGGAIEEALRLNKRALALPEKTWSRIRRKGTSYTKWRYKTRRLIALGEAHASGGREKKPWPRPGRWGQSLWQNGSPKR